MGEYRLLGVDFGLRGEDMRLMAIVQGFPQGLSFRRAQQGG